MTPRTSENLSLGGRTRPSPLLHVTYAPGDSIAARNEITRTVVRRPNETEYQGDEDASNGRDTRGGGQGLMR